MVAAAALGGGTTASEGSDSDNETSTIVVGCTRISAGTVEHFPSSSITFLISGFISGFQGEEHRCCLTFLYPIVCCTADEKEALLRTPCLLNPPASPPSPFQSTNKWLSPSSESDIILPQFCFAAAAAAAAATASLSLSLSLHYSSEYFHYRKKMSALKKRETRVRRKAATIITKLLDPFVAPRSVLSFLGARAPHIARARTGSARRERFRV
jgi:hypothetical protein